MTTASAILVVPISEMQEADLPLTGTELVPIVQGGVNRQAPASAFGGISPGAVVWTGQQSQALAAGANNNLAPDISEASRLNCTPADDTAEFRGLAGGSDGKMLFVVNRSTANFFTVVNESGTSTAANRFAINGDIIIPARCGALFMYDGTLARWVKA